MGKNTEISRRAFIAGATGAVLHTMSAADKANSNERLMLYIGTYTSVSSKSEGIYVYKFDPKTGVLTRHKVVSGVAEPSFLAISKDRRFLFAVNETLEYEGKKSGAVSAFAIDKTTGDLRFISKQPSLCGAPCHISVSGNGNFVLVANYVGGNVAVLPVGKDGSLGAPSDLKQHKGSGPNVKRQEASHAHSVILDEENRFAFVNDLGIDQIAIYAFDHKTGKLTENNNQASYAARPGAGPRHFKIHPNSRLAFVNNELDMTLSSLAFDEKKGTLREIQTVSTLPSGYKDSADSGADLHISPDGDFLYASNRGDDSIASYRIDKKSGMLDLVEHVPTGGKTPRNFVIDPLGNYLLAANQNSNSIVVFRIDKASGKLTRSGNPTNVPSPVCLVFG